MKEQLIKMFEKKMSDMDFLDMCSMRRSLFDQCFGAVWLACELLDDVDKENEIIELWNEWKEKMEAKVYER